MNVGRVLLELLQHLSAKVGLLISHVCLHHDQLTRAYSAD